MTLLIESITDVSEVNMDLTTTFVIYQSWTDPRLKVASDSKPLKRNMHNIYIRLRNFNLRILLFMISVVLPSRLIQHLWVPDTYVVGSKVIL